MRNLLQLFTGLLFVAHCSFAQNIGLGTTTPQARLHIKGTGGGTQIILEENAGSILRISNEPTGTGPYIGTSTNHPLSFVTNNSVKLSLTTAGNLGIGTNTPQKLLSVAGGAVLDQNNNNTGTSSNILSFGSLSGEGIGSKRTDGTNQFGLDFYTNNAQRMTITNAGRVGVGTNTPHASSILDISSTTAGITIPRMLKSQREAISNPQAGLLVFDLNYKAIFVFDGLNWVPLVPGSADGLAGGPQSPADNTSGSQFGFSTGIDSLWAISGAPSQNSSVGAAYIYQRVNGDWVEAAKLLPDEAMPQLFGASVSIDYPYAVVGAPGRNTYSGCAYVFFHNGSNWVQVNKFFKPVNNVPLNYFGNSVDISGNHLVVGSPGADDVVSNGGAVYTYRFNGSNWVFQNTLTSSSLTTNAAFGTSVAVAGTNIVAGAPGLPSGGRTGECFFYLFTAGNWVLVPTFPPVATLNQFIIDDFGAAVDIHYQPGSFYSVSVVVGAPASYYSFVGNPAIQNIGAAFVFWGGQTGFTETSGTFFSPSTSSDYFEYQGYKYGSAVSVSHTGTSDNRYPGLAITIHVGRPGRNNSRGGIYLHSFKAGFDLGTGFPTGDFTKGNEGFINAASSNNKLGSAVDMFDKYTSIAGAPGSNANKGSVIFDY